MRNLFFLTTLLLFCQFTFAESKQVRIKHRELQHINQEIKKIKLNIKTAKIKRSNLIDYLKKSEIKINEITQSLNHVDSKLQQQQQILQQLFLEDKALREQISQQKSLLAKQIRVAYQMGHNEDLKLLLNQEDPTLINRLVHYQMAIKVAREELIESINKTMRHLIISKQKTLRHTQALQHLIQLKKEHKHVLQNENNKRQEILAAIETQLETRAEKLQHMFENKKALQALLKRLRAKSKQQRAQGFSKQVHALQLPTRGHITTHFADWTAHAQLRSNGLVIRAKQNQAIRAIFAGKVVFADWLKGFGLLLIIDHGEGYMSLYAHNQNLLVQTGDTVSTNQTIARVGHSGGEKQAGLYFEIRHNGKPINPMRWCSNKSRRVKSKQFV